MSDLKEQLNIEFKKFYDMKFPSVPLDLDIAAELALEDGYLAGYIISHLAGSRIDFKSMNLDYIFDNIKRYTPKDNEEKKEVEYIKSYIEQMIKTQNILQADLEKVVSK